MGEEFGADCPFYYFCDFEATLAENITRGRRAEFAQFSQFSSPEQRKLIPDPNAEKTYLLSKLDWSKSEQQEHLTFLRLYQILLDIRRREIIPRLSPGESRQTAQAGYRILSEKALKAWWKMADDSGLTVLFNLQQESVDCSALTMQGRLLYHLAPDDRDPLQSGLLPPKSIFWYLDNEEGELMPEDVLRELGLLFGMTIERVPAKNGLAGGEGERLLAVLQAAGVPIKNFDHAADLLLQLRQEQWQQMLDPVQVVSESDMPVSLLLRLPETAKQRYEWVLTEEEGRQHHGSFSRHELNPVSAPAEPVPRSGLYRLDAKITLPCGYHQFVIRDRQHQQEQVTAKQLLIVTPQQCYLPPNLTGDSRVWGIGSHLHALRSRNSWGIGEFADLQQLLSLSAAQGAATVHTGPLHCPSSMEFPNPYRPCWRSGLNVLFINIENVEDFVESDEVQSHVADARFQARLAALRNQQQIDYQAIAAIKDELFKKLWKHFSDNHLNPETARGSEFRDFQQRSGKTLRYYAIFSAIREEFLRADFSRHDWREWPASHRSPQSKAVSAFAAEHEQDIEYQQYLQWQAELQLAAVGRRSMELGLKVGLLTEYAYNVDPAGFESWYYKELVLPDTVIAGKHAGSDFIDPAEGLSPLSPSGLKKNCYQPFIEGLRHAMRYAGAVIIRSIDGYFRIQLKQKDRIMEEKVYLTFPFDELLGILSLESQRNRCLVIVDQIDQLPRELQTKILSRNIFTTTVLFQAWDQKRNWQETEDYPANSLVSTAAPFLASMKGLWKGRDISQKTEENYFQDDTEKERAILARVSARAHFLISLSRAGLLPEDRSLDPAAVAGIDHALIAAGQVLLARSPAKILLVSLNDLQDIEAQAEPPALVDQHFWHLRYATELENLIDGREIKELFATLCRERGAGVVHPSILAPDRKKGQGLSIPTAFYRLQLNKDFTFSQAAEIIPYLKGLGISHCYVSPFLTARPGSSHGYDIIDHCSLNPEIGSRRDFEDFVAVLEDNRLALLLDIVPNHMGIGSDNQWWMDVLENGQTSKYAGYFDINWQPQQADLIGRVLLPVLGDHYGKTLENGQLNLCFNKNSGSFTIAYYQQRFPVDPGTYPFIMHHDLQRLSSRLGKQHNGYLELQNLISSFENLPDRLETTEEKLRIRQRDKEVSKRILARLCRELPEIDQFIAENVILFNGSPGKPESFDLLHDLLEKQAYRLAFWRVAADEINYRRFFDINDLAGLRVEEIEVFRATHRLILDLITTGKVDGLRVDHPDGLYDPRGYFFRLEAAAAGESFENMPPTQPTPTNRKKVSLYVVAEKILADFEHLPGNWPICGTTGYDFSNLLNGLLLDSSAEKSLTSLYHRFIGSRLDFDQMVYDGKKRIIESAMVGELNVLATLLFRLARSNRLSRDFTLNRLRQALIEIIACFPVYRTYIDSENIREEDLRFIEWAVARAKKQQLNDPSILDFIKSVLLLEPTAGGKDFQKRLDFVLKFQQYTGPVMAKGLEDTSFFIYNRLLSLNDVGGEPKRFGTSLAAFHHTNQERLRHWPHAMLNSSTHDSKRSEDVRVRINVLTEMEPKWRQQVYHWRNLNRGLRTHLDQMTAPSRNDEYAFYQNLLGVWPNEDLDAEGHRQVVSRIKEAMLKTCREAKVHTSWTSANEPYEKAVIDFVEKALAWTGTPFLENFLPFQKEVGWFGMLNGLTQVFLKLVSPGIPDIYQGNEIWRFCLVDPDNRRPVDFRKRQAMLRSMQDRLKTATGGEELYLRELLMNLPDGRAKMFVISGALGLRNSWPEVFESGSYIPLEVTGRKKHHICAFARQSTDRIVVAVAPRLLYTLTRGRKELPLGEKIWQDTKIKLPVSKNWSGFENIYAASRIEGEMRKTDGDSIVFRAADLLCSWPLALLTGVIS